MPRLPFGFALGTTAVLMVTSEFAHQQLDRSRAQAVAVRTALADAIDASTVQLVGSSHQISRDPAVRDHIARGRDHSLQETLRSKVAPQELDGLALLSPSCRGGYASSALPSWEERCQDLSDGLQWHRSDGSAVLTLKSTIKVAERHFWLLLSLRLDNAWLRSQGRLASLVEAPYRLTTRLEGGYPLARYGEIGGGRAALYLEAQDFRLPLAATVGALTAEPLPSPLRWPLLTVLIILLAVALQRSRALAIQRRRALTALSAWGRGGDGSAGNEPPAIADPELKAAADHLFAGIERLHWENERLTAEAQEAGRNAELREQRLAAQDHLLRRREGIEALGQWLTTAGPAIGAKMNGWGEQLEDLDAVISRGMSSAVASLEEQLGRWHQGITEKGPRTFVRDLCEQERDKTPLLLHELTALRTQAGQLRDQVLNSGLMTKMLLYDNGALAQIVTTIDRWARWEQRDEAPKLDEMVRSAAALVQWQQGPLAWEAEPVALPDTIPMGIWICGLFHMMNYIYANTNAQRVIFKSKGRLLMIAAPGATAIAAPDPRSLRAAEDLFRPFGIGCQRIKSDPGLFSLSVSWSEPRPETAGATTRGECESPPA